MRFSREQLEKMFEIAGKDFSRFLDLWQMAESWSAPPPERKRKKRADAGKPRNGQQALEVTTQ